MTYSQAIGEIISFGLWMRRQGYRESTIQPCIRALKAIARRADLLNPEAAKSYLASAPVTENRKDKLADDLSRFYRYKHIPFDKPRHRRIEVLPFIPQESEIDQLISSMGNKTATFLQLLKETGIRPGEAWNLRWIDIDPDRPTVNIAPEKNSRPRQLKISSQLIGMLNGLHHKDGFVFRNPNVDPIRSLDDFSRNFSERRRKLAKKLDKPQILRIGFRTLRHFKATTEYHKTRDILHVMQLLGHKSIKNTLVYTHLVDFGGDDFICKVARSVDEAKELVESGFDYVTDVGGMKLFRKRK